MSATTLLPEIDPAYRPGVGAMLCNRDGLVFVAQRIDTPSQAWQMPQGGIDPGEAPELTVFRELKEEIGTDKATVRAVTPGWLAYDLPVDLRGTLWKGRYRGQCQKWFLLDFTGTDADINLQTAHPEFNRWRWAEPRDLPELIVPFKRDLYVSLLDQFRPHLTRL